MRPLWPHQARFLEANPNKALLCWEMRTGKTLPASLWSAHPSRNGNPIVICLKQNVTDWKREAPHATVFSKEQFKKHYQTIERPTCLVIDECHMCASGLFTKGRSQLATAVYTFIRNNPTLHVLLLTATPIRNSPSSLHTLLCYLGHDIPWKKWRAHFYSLESRPYLRFPAWLPKPNWRSLMEPVLQKYANIVSLRDCVGTLPPATDEVITIKNDPYVPEPDELPTWTTYHQAEQAGKAEAIKALGYRKLIVVAHYTDQIDALAKELEAEKPVFVLDGRTKDPDAVKRAAQEAPECYFIVQASMGMGWDGYMFSALVFASMSHSYVSFIQMRGRLRHPLHLHPAVYYFLIGGIWDNRIYMSLKAGEDFNPFKYEN